MNIAKRQNETVNVEFDFTDKTTGEVEHIVLNVRKNNITPRMFKDLASLEKDNNFYAVAEMLSRMVVDWNIDFNGEPFPPTLSNMENCDNEFLTACIEGISALWVGKSETPKQSENISELAANSVN